MPRRKTGESPKNLESTTSVEEDIPTEVRPPGPRDRPCLLVLAGVGMGMAFPLEQRELVLGRAPGADLRIPSDSVSRRHVGFRLGEDGTLEARDLGSKNGTYYEGRRVEEVVLHNGE